MSGKRLQAEIDRVLKKVSEGSSDFENTMHKISNASNTNQKEKYEQDLKKEIKKLQRYRDKIKTWIQSNDVKNKAPLMEHRRNIEQKMEQFKICEKESKTKAYSKEGLAQVTPEENPELSQTREWLSESLKNLNSQIEAFESEIECIPSKKRKSESVKIENLKTWIDKHQFHVIKVEQILRLLDNESMDIELIQEIKDGLDYYIEENQQPDFYEDEELYESLGLDNENAPAIVVLEKKVEVEEEIEKETVAKQPIIPKKETTTSPETINKQPSNNNTNTINENNVTTNTSVNTNNVNNRSENVNNTNVINPRGDFTPQTRGTRGNSRGAENRVNPKQIIPTVVPKEEPPVLTKAYGAAVKGTNEPAVPTPNINANTTKIQPKQQPEKILKEPVARQNFQQQPQPQNKPKIGTLAELSSASLQQKNTTNNNTNSNNLGLSQEFQRKTDMLEASLLSIPEPVDSERPRQYPRGSFNPTNNTPAFYPQTPLPIFENPSTFEKFDTDTLFFIFYYQQGTYQQYLAARELKKQSWRYHKKYLTWFQRHEEPKEITNDYEQGTYVYFDYETGWCQRKKN